MTWRNVLYGVICLTSLAMLGALAARTSGALNLGTIVVAPASLDAMVTISTSPDRKFTFITCASHNPSMLRRLFHSTLSCAFIAQHFKPTHNVAAHAGEAHLEFLGDFLSVDFADHSRSVFTVAPEGAYREKGDVEYSNGLATYRVTGYNSHISFVKSRNWTKSAASCGL